MADTHKNFAKGTLTNSPGTAGTSFVLSSGEGALFAANMPVTIVPANTQPDGSNAEIGYVTGVSTDTLTVTRAQQDTTAKNAVAGWQVLGTITAKALTDIEADVAGKADTGHTHTESDISDLGDYATSNDLTTGLAGKSDTSHLHDDRYYTETETNTLLSGKAASTHSHAISDVTNLQTTLDGKAATSHTHTASQVTDFDTEVSNNADVSANTAVRHTHSNKAVLDATTASFTTADETKLDGVESGAQVNTVTPTNSVTLTNKTLTEPVLTGGASVPSTPSAGVAKVFGIGTSNLNLGFMNESGTLRNITSELDGKADQNIDADEFEELSSFNQAGNSNTQGIAFDGTYFYVTSTTHIYKYNTSGTLQTSRNVSADVAGNSHVGDGVVVGSTLYIPLNNYPTTPRTTVVARFNTSDLSFIGSTSIGAVWAGAMTYKDGYFWVLEENYILKKWNTTFSTSTSYTLPISLYSVDGVYDYDGVEWVNDHLYINPHSGASPNVIQQFSFNGTAFIRTRTVLRPTSASQGMVWSDTNQRMYFATRETTGKVLTTQMVPDDRRSQRVETVFYNAAVYSTTSTSYAEDTNTAAQVSIYAKKGDIIRVNVVGLYKVSASSMRSYVFTTSTSPVSVTQLTADTPTMRTNFTGSDYTTLTTERYLKANATGTVTFTTYNRVMAAATLSREQILISAQIVGRDVETYI